ncbi:hypothetical protein MYK68_03440 [Gordonia sp. PP30]|uniref:hypothetical protein n=1 Tax=Gordonia sp. PP30 TaxID=2935861 RepID=UPI001FFF8397|nr:hypothetical protein [Gordonia sp. PP30]UQE75687.1 hypothetical protein MYK68_03440 [Gordonia sp. PP30]
MRWHDCWRDHRPPGPAADAIDEHSLAFLTGAFADLLGGRPLLGNRSQWFRFRTSRCARWADGNMVLLGDAAANADPSLGSGTKLAAESAIALADALDADRPIEESLRAFEAQRRPAVDRFQRWACRSQRWWDSFPARLSMDGDRLALAFMSRLRPVPLTTTGDLATIIVPAVAAWAGVSPGELPDGDLTDWITHRPARIAGAGVGGRIVSQADLAAAGVHVARIDSATDDPWGPDADRVLAAARTAIGDGADAILLAGPPDSTEVLERMDVAERIRFELGVPTGVAAPAAQTGAIACGLVAGRIDFACDTGFSRDRRPAR